MVNKARVQKLVKILKSGKYKQGRSALRPKEDKFCCLGVACDVYAKETGESLWTVNRTQSLWEEGKYRFARARTMLPTKVAKYFGISKRRQLNLAEMNDDGQSFKKIADYMEKNLLTK